MAEVIRDSTEVIFETECIGESLPKINTNFFNLDLGLEKTSTTLVSLSSKVDNLKPILTGNAGASVGPLGTLPTGYVPGGIQLSFNKDTYSIQGIVRDSAINTTKLGGDIASAGKNLVVRPQLSSLTDIKLTNIQLGHIIKWDGAKWINTIDVGRVRLSELDDVQLPADSAIRDRYILRWDKTIVPSGKWVASRDVGKEWLYELNDVNINTRNLPNQNNFFLRYSLGTNKWVPDVGFVAGLGITIDQSKTIRHLPHAGGDVYSTAADPLRLIIDNNTVTSAKLRSSSTDNSLRAVDSDHIRNGAVITRTIENLNVTTAKLAGDGNEANDSERAVTTNKIRNLNVTNAKLAGTPAGPDQARAVSTDKIRNSSITTEKIANGAVTTNKIANEDVTTAKLAGTATGPNSQRAVTTDKIRNSAITTEKIANGAITVPKCGFQPITSIVAGKNVLLENTRQTSSEGAALADINGEQIKIHTLGHFQWIDNKSFSMTPAFYYSYNWMKAYGSWYPEEVPLGDGTVISTIRLKRDGTTWQSRALISFTTVAPIDNPAELSIYWLGNGSSSFPAYNFNRSVYTRVIQGGVATNRYTWNYAPTSPGPYDNWWYNAQAVKYRFGKLWLGGRFDSMGALPSQIRTRRNFAAINIDNPNEVGSVTAYQPTPALTNGAVTCIEHFRVGSSNFVALGGSFNIAGGGRGLVIMNADNGQTVQWYTFRGNVWSLHARGNYLYVGGDYTGGGRGNVTNYNQLGNYRMLTRINITTLNFDTAWSLDVGGFVNAFGSANHTYTIKSTPTRIWIGGWFAFYTRGKWRHGMLAAFDINSGALVDFNEDIYFNSWIRRIVIDDPNGSNPILYVAGTFGAIYEGGTHMYYKSNGRYYQYVAAVQDINTNQPRVVRAWNPRPGSYAYAIDVDTGPNSQVYIGGLFHWIVDAGVQSSGWDYNYRYHIAAISKVNVGNATVQDWKPDTDGAVYDIDVTTIGGRKVVMAAGSFSSVNYTKRASTQERRVDVAFLPPFPIPSDLPVTNPQTVRWTVGGTYAGPGGNIWLETQEVQNITVPVQPLGNINITKVALNVGSVSKGSLARFFVQRTGGTYPGDDVDVIGLSLDWDTIDDPNPLATN